MYKFIFIPLFCAASSGGFAEEALPTERDLSALEFGSRLQDALRENDWWAAIDYADVIANLYPESPFAGETEFLIGESFYHLGQLELANEHFSTYLNQSVAPSHFDEAMRFKFNVAEAFRQGVKKPLFGSHKLPKIISGEEDALQIYEEVISALPHDEMAAKALLGKAELQTKAEDYKPALETLDLLIRRFPKQSFAAQGFLEKSHVYLLQAQEGSSDPALLGQADINLRKFRLAFPREETIAQAENDLALIQEIFAEHLMETGRFFQKTKKIPAAKLYYTKVLSQFPQTKAAMEAQERMACLPESYTKINK